MPPERVNPDRYIAAVSLLNELIRTGQTKEALEAARRWSSLVGAALCYEIATMIASASRDTTENVGVVHDDLATVRRLQQRFDDATTASDRALAIFDQFLADNRLIRAKLPR